MKLISIVGFKGTGKTRLVESLIKRLSSRGRVGTIKHYPGHAPEEEGDTGRHLEAGATMVIGVDDGLRKTTQEGGLQEALDSLADAGIDYAIVEGFKQSSLPKIALGHVEVEELVARYTEPDDVDLDEILSLVEAQSEYHTLQSLIQRAKRNPDLRYAGAIATFTGIVRGVTGDTVTRALEFEKYSGVAEEKMSEICSSLGEREGIVDVLMHHRTGKLYPGDDIVYIVVSGAHREEVFEVLREAIEQLKEIVPIWKKEITEDGDWWVE